MEGYLATILMFAGNFAPRAWSFCNGSLLAISQNEALFSLLGTTYGGDGITTFALPDLRGRIPVGTGQGGGLSMIVLGEQAGTESVTMTTQTLAIHAHPVTAAVGVTTGNADGSNNPANAMANSSQNVYTALANGTNTNLGGVTATIGLAGSSQPIPIVQSYQAINYVICLEGIYPSQG